MSIAVNNFLNNVVIDVANIWNPVSKNCYISSSFLLYRYCNQKAIPLNIIL